VSNTQTNQPKEIRTTLAARIIPQLAAAESIPFQISWARSRNSVSSASSHGEELLVAFTSFAAMMTRVRTKNLKRRGFTSGILSESPASRP